MTQRRDMLRVTAARFISRMGSEAAFFVGIWGKAAFEFRSDPGRLALLMLTLSVSSIIGSVVAGVLVDRYGPKRVLMTTEAVFVPVALSLTLARDMVQLTLLATLLGLCNAPIMTAAASFGPFLAGDDKSLKRVNAWIEGAGSASFVFGPAAGALLARFVSIDSVFVFDAATSLVAAGLVAGMALEPLAREKKDGRPFAEMLEGMKATYSARPLRYFVMSGTVVWLGFGAFSALEPLFYRDVVHTGVETIGYANTIFGAGLVLGAALMTRLPDMIVSARGLSIAVVATGLGTVFYVGSPDIRRVFVGALLWGAIIGVLDPLLRTLIQRDSPPSLVGRIAGTSHIHRQGGELLPLAFAPFLAARFGVQKTLLGGGLFVAVVGALSFFEAAAIDRTRPAAAAERASFSVADEPVSPNP